MHIGRTKTYTTQRFLIRVKYTAQCFLIRIKSIAIPTLTINRTTFAVYVANATHKGKKAWACCGVHLLVKRRRFCSFCLFKPGFCEFLAKNLFKMRYYAIFRLFITVFTIKRHIVPRCGAFMKEKKAFFFPMYNAGYASFRFHLMKAKQL